MMSIKVSGINYCCFHFTALPRPLFTDRTIAGDLAFIPHPHQFSPIEPPTNNSQTILVKRYELRPRWPAVPDRPPVWSHCRGPVQNVPLADFTAHEYDNNNKNIILGRRDSGSCLFLFSFGVVVFFSPIWISTTADRVFARARAFVEQPFLGPRRRVPSALQLLRSAGVLFDNDPSPLPTR